MKQFITIILFLFFVVGVQAQDLTDSTIIVLRQEIKELRSANKKLKCDLERQKQQLRALSDSVRTELEKLNKETSKATSQLDNKSTETEKTTQTQIIGVTESVGKKTLFGIIGGAVLLLLSVGLFFWLYVKRKADSASIVKQLEDQKSSLETKLVKEYSSQADVLENLMKTIRELRV
ncbi:MAG: hypothetical protein LBD53_09970 [Tannerella sp.]|jgi:predicted PurR-regulated permease PerM|nr:hypothetical protein [Tannerella sp.]